MAATRHDAEEPDGSPNGGPLTAFLTALDQHLEKAQGDFGETLLDQELWSSVDLLQNVALQNMQVLDGLEQRLGAGDAAIEPLKIALREGRARFSDWLFERFRQISTDQDPTGPIKETFQIFFAAMEEACRVAPADLRLPLEPGQLIFQAGDGLGRRLKKGLLRLRCRLGLARMERQFSPRHIAMYYLLGQLPRRMVRVADKLGAAELFLLKSLKSLYEEIDRSYNGFFEELDRLGPGDKTTTAILREEVNESFRLVGRDVLQYFGEVRQVFEDEIAAVRQQVTAAAAVAGGPGAIDHSLAVEGKAIGLKALGRRIDQWGRYRVGFTGNYVMELEIARFQNRLRYAVDETVVLTNRHLAAHLEEQLGLIDNRCAATFAFLKEGWAQANGLAGIRQGIERERSELIDFLRNKVLGQLEAVRGSAEISQLIDIVRERFGELAEETEESFLIVEEDMLPVDQGFLPATPVELKVAPVRAVVRTYLERDLVPRLGELNGAMIAQIKRLETHIDEFWHVVSFSLGNVAVELRESDKEPGELMNVALNRMQRSLRGLRTSGEELRQDGVDIHERLVQAVADTARLLKKLVLEESVGTMQRRIARKGRLALKRRLLLGWRKVVASLPLPQDHPLSRLRHREAAEEEVVDHAQSYQAEGIDGLEEDLLRKVPFAYRQLFRTNPLEVSEFLSGRSGALGAIKEARDRWRQGSFSPVVLVGEQGSGKTSLINCALEQILKGIPLVRHRLDRFILEEEQLVVLLNDLLGLGCRGLDELEERIGASHERRIVILEDVHQLHLRAWGGLDLFERFLAFIDTTGSHILWLISIDQYAWQYLDYATGASRHFAFHIETGRLSPKELEGAIMARHRSTGYVLLFVDDQGREDGEQGRLHRQFFQRLSAACGGNVFAAIFYWLRSIQRAQGETLFVGPLEEMRLDFLAGLALEDLLDLAMVVEHGGLNAENFATIFQLEASMARQRLNRLTNIGTLRRQNDSYVLNPILYHPIVSQLKKRHVVG